MERSKSLRYRIWIYNESLPPTTRGKPTLFGPLCAVEFRYIYAFFNIARKAGWALTFVSEGPDAEKVMAILQDEVAKREQETRMKSMGEAFREYREETRKSQKVGLTGLLRKTAGQEGQDAGQEMRGGTWKH